MAVGKTAASCSSVIRQNRVGLPVLDDMKVCWHTYVDASIAITSLAKTFGKVSLVNLENWTMSSGLKQSYNAMVRNKTINQAA